MPTSKADKFILNSDFATIKNDSGVLSGSISMSGSQIVTPGNTLTQTVDIVIGTINAPMTFFIKHSYNDQYNVSGNIQYIATGKVGGVDTVYTTVIYAYRLNATTVRLSVSTYNPNLTNLTTETTARTITLYVRTYLSPFN